MSTPGRSLLWLATLLMVGAGGFFLGRLVPAAVEDATPKKSVSSLSKYRPPQEKAVPARETKTASAQKAQTQVGILRLPKAIFDRLFVSFEFQRNGFVPGGLLIFGVPLESLPPMKAAIDDAVKQIKELEVAHSELLPDGGFHIRPFTGEGAAVREKLMATLRPFLDEFDDDRMVLLEGSLVRCEAFRSFGNSRTRIHFHEVKNPEGQTEWQGTEEIDYLNRITDKRSLHSPDSQERLQRLMAKHIPGG